MEGSSVLTVSFHQLCLSPCPHHAVNWSQRLKVRPPPDTLQQRLVSGLFRPRQGPLGLNQGTMRPIRQLL